MPIKKPNDLDRAHLFLTAAENETDGEGTEHAAKLIQLAQVHAILAVVDELVSLRDSVEGLAGSIADQDGFSPGTHLRHISDWTERIAKNG